MIFLVQHTIIHLMTDFSLVVTLLVDSFLGFYKNTKVRLQIREGEIPVSRDFFFVIEFE